MLFQELPTLFREAVELPRIALSTLINIQRDSSTMPASISFWMCL